MQSPPISPQRSPSHAAARASMHVPMHPHQREHIATVMHVADSGISAPHALVHDEVIRASWSRCVHEHRLDPTRMQEAVILPSGQLREHQDRIEDFLHIARHGMEALYQQVAGMGYCVLLTDARGVTVDFIGDLTLDASLRKAGLYLGADWSEQHAGTCGVGTAIATGEALTVHLDDHFDATHIPLTCTTAPVFDATGQLTAILDISALSSPQPKSSQHLALQLVKVYAQRIENANFLHRFRNDWILRLSPAPQFLDVNPEFLLAVDAGGTIIGHNRRAQRLLQSTEMARPVQRPLAPPRADSVAPPTSVFGDSAAADAVIGQPFGRFFNARLEELGRFVPIAPSHQRTVALARSGRVLFMLASPPPVRPVVREARTVERKLPAPLAALSGGDAVLDRQLERAARLVDTPISLLLTGETGSGKEYFAKAVHHSSGRRSRPFVAVNCAAIPESLIESELFGHLAGSFSGAAAKGKRGLIAEADGGTLFLDEIGDMPRELQARLLRVLAEREVLPVGATRPVPVDIRVIAATHCTLEALVREGRFREDLYYRLNGAHITLPPLRERADLRWLVQRILGEHANAGGIAPVLSAAAAERLTAHRWPGNLRELRNAIEFSCAVCSGGRIEVPDLPDGIGGADGDAFGQSPLQEQSAHPLATEASAAHADERTHLLAELRASRGNVSAAARRLGISRMTMYRRMKRAEIHVRENAE